MKFYLAHNQLACGKWKCDEEYKNAPWDADVFKYTHELFCRIIPVASTQTEKQKCTQLETLLVEFFEAENTDEQNGYKWKLWLEIGISLSRSNPSGSSFRASVELKSDGSKSCLHALREISKNNAKLQIEISKIKHLPLAEYRPNSSPKYSSYFAIPQAQVFTEALKISQDVSAMCVDKNIDLPYEYYSSQYDRELMLLCAVTVTIPGQVLYSKHKPTKLICLKNPLYKKMLDEGIMSDVTIIAADGACIPAHKCILATQSSVFFSMFSTDMSENRESKIEIPDMTEQSIHNFLRYLYYQTEVREEENLEQILEVYKAAHKYDVESAEMLMRARILEQPTNWFDLDTTLQLFEFAQKLSPVDEDIRIKVLDVLKILVKNFKEATLYEKLLLDHPAAAVELCKLSLSSDTDL